MVWIDRATRTVSVAQRSDGNALELYRSWSRWVERPAFPAPAEQKLVELVLEGECRRAKAGTLEGLNGVLAAIDCVPSGVGASTLSYYQFADADSLRRSYSAEVSQARAPEGVDCLDAAVPEFLGDRVYYADGVTAAGRLLCQNIDGSRPLLTWTADPLLLLGRVGGTDRNSLTDWWLVNYATQRDAIIRALNEQAQPPFPTAEESALLNRVPPASRLNCRRPARETVRGHTEGATVVGVTCETTNGPYDVFYYQYSDPAALAVASGAVAGAPDCQALPPQFLGSARYTRPDGSTGNLACAVSSAGDAYLLWTDDQKLIGALAIADGADDPAALIAWWQTQAGPS
jgi:hypothetical protein